MRKPISLILCFGLPALFLVGGFVLAGLYGFRKIPEIFQESARGTLPEGFVVRLNKAGKYTVWLSLGDGRDFSDAPAAEELPPGSRLFVFDDASGRELEVSRWGQSTKFIGDEKSVSLGSFEAVRPEQLIEVKGTGFSEPVMVSVSPATTRRTLGVVLTLVGIVGVTLTVSIFSFVTLIQRRQCAVDSLSGG